MCINMINGIRYKKSPSVIPFIYIYIYLKTVITKVDYFASVMVMLKVNLKWQEETGVKDVHSMSNVHLKYVRFK